MRRAARRLAPALAVPLAMVCALTGLTAMTGCGGDPTVAAGWTLTWRDDFDRLDETHWNVQDFPSTRNEEWQYYTPDDVAVSGGRLRLTSRRDVPKGDRTFASGAVDTYGKFAVTHGRVEITAQLPAMGQGIWPALWLLGTDCHPSGDPCPWPTKGATEIDIMEAVNQSSPYYANLHYGTEPGRSESSEPLRHEAGDLSAGLHTYAVEWDAAGNLRWFLDRSQIGERSAPGWFDGPMYILMNTALGGTWPGPVAESTVFPQEFQIDSVRVYQR